MGCNGSKSVAVLATADETTAPDDSDSLTPKSPSASSTVPTAEEGGAVTRPVTPQPIPPSMAFEIPLDDSPTEGSGDPSIVKKHPPRRLQRLEEQQQQLAPISLDDLHEKQQEAENRRLHFLQLRAQSAKRKYAARNNNDHEHLSVTEVEDVAEDTPPASQ